MVDFLLFRRMITPYFVQLLFWIGFLAILVISAHYAGLVDTALSDSLGIYETNLGASAAVLIFGSLYWRMICELLVVMFSINEGIRKLNKR